MEKNKTVLVASPIPTHPQQSGNSTRVFDVCKILLELGYEVHFCLIPINEFGFERNDTLMDSYWNGRWYELLINKDSMRPVHAHLLQKLKRFLLNYKRRKFFNYIFDFYFMDGLITKSMVDSFGELIKKIGPNIIVTEYAALSKLVSDIPSSIIKIVDTNDTFTNRNARIRKEGGDSNWLSFLPFQEKAQLKRFDSVIAIQENEYDFFNTLLQNIDTKVFLLDVLDFPKEVTISLDDAPTIGFIGANSRHNYEGLKIFLELHWISIKKLIPNAKFFIAGAIYDDLLYFKEFDVSFLGRVSSLSDFYNSVKIIVNPTMTGSGLKIKSVEALSYGKALVTTTEGAMGLLEAENKCIFISSLKSTSFAETIIDLLIKNSYLQLQEEALAFIELKRNNSIDQVKNALRFRK